MSDNNNDHPSQADTGQRQVNLPERDEQDARLHSYEQSEALSYLKEMVPALRVIAASADLPFLAHLLDLVAEEVAATERLQSSTVSSEFVHSN